MNAQELRLGNYVRSIWAKDDYLKVIAVQEKLITLNEAGNNHHITAVEPVLLTEEWLLKFDAIELVHLNDDYKRFNLDGIQLSISPVDRDYFVEYAHQIPIKYVHTLQNFYFATKQKELEEQP